MTAAIQLFKELDIQGSGKNTWDDFVAYCSNLVDNQEKLRPEKGINSLEHLFLIDNYKKNKLTEFSKFKHQEHIKDHGPHKKTIRQVLYNKGPSWISTMKPVIMYCEEKSNFLCWLSVSSMEVVKTESVPASGGFVKSIDYENFEQNNNLCHQIQCHTLYAVSCTDNKIHLYKQQSTRIHYFRSFDIGKATVQKLFYLREHEVWLCSCKDLMVRQFKIEKKTSLELGKPIKLHNDEMTAVTELSSPYKCILTCGMDKRVVMYDLIKRQEIRVLPGHHSTSVRKFESFPEWGNLLLSIGSEQDVLVWAMDNVISDPIYGRMRGHKTPTTDCCRFPKGPFGITIDTLGTVKIWDVRKLACMQTLIQDPIHSQDVRMGLQMISAETFMSIGLRMKVYQVTGSLAKKNNIFQTEPLDVQIKARKMKQPKFVCFNKYYQMLVVVTSRDIKMYRLRDGFMQTLVADVFEDPTTTIQDFKLDKRERRCYVTSSKGETKIINIMNGVTLKTLPSNTFNGQEMTSLHQDGDKVVDTIQHSLSPTRNPSESSSDESQCESDQSEQDRSLKKKFANLVKRGSIGVPIEVIQARENYVKEGNFEILAHNMRKSLINKEVFTLVKLEHENTMNKYKRATEGKLFLTEKPKEVQQLDASGRTRPVRLSDDILEMILIDQPDLRQILACDKDSFFVMDDCNEKSDSKDEHSGSNLMRVVTGAHTDDICCVAFSYEMSLVATGGVNGEVCVYDFERSKLLDCCVSHQQDITSIHFLWPYPVMVTTGSDCQVCLWKVRHVGSDDSKVTCLQRFLNISMNYTENIKKLCPAPINCSCTMIGDSLLGIQREKKHLSHDKIILGAETYRDFKKNAVLAKMETFVTRQDDGEWRGPSESQKLRQRLINNYMTWDYVEGRNKIDIQFDKENQKSNANIQQKPMRLLDKNYDQDLDKLQSRVYLYFGDEFGFIKLWDLTYICQQAGSKQSQTHAEWKGKRYFPFRIEGIEINSLVTKTKYKNAKKRAKTHPEFIDPLQSMVQLREVKAHKEIQINCISVDQKNGFLTSASDDYQVKLWSAGLDFWGNIHQLSEKVDPKWYYPAEVLAAERFNDLSQSKQTLIKLPSVQNQSAMAQLKSLIDMNNTKPQIKEEQLLDETNCSIDSIEQRLQESLLGLPHPDHSDVGSDVEVGKYERDKSFLTREEERHEKREKSLRRHKKHLKTRVKELTGKIVMLAFSHYSEKKERLKVSFIKELNLVQSEMNRTTANEALKKRQMRLEDEAIERRSERRQLRKMSNSHSQPALFITEKQEDQSFFNQIAELDEKSSDEGLKNPIETLHKNSKTQLMERRSAKHGRRSIQMTQYELSDMKGKARLQTSKGYRDEQGGGQIPGATMKFIKTNTNELSNFQQGQSDKPGTTRDQTFESRYSSSQRQKLNSATGMRRHGSVVHFASSQPSIQMQLGLKKVKAKEEKAKLKIQQRTSTKLESTWLKEQKSQSKDVDKGHQVKRRTTILPMQWEDVMRGQQSSNSHQELLKPDPKPQISFHPSEQRPSPYENQTTNSSLVQERLNRVKEKHAVILQKKKLLGNVEQRRTISAGVPKHRQKMH